jgi:hypothetical protein
VPSFPWAGVPFRKKTGDFETGLLLRFEVERDDSVGNKRKREDSEEPKKVKKESDEAEAEEEEDKVEELDADGESAKKKQKTETGDKKDRPVAPAMRVKAYFRTFGDVGYVEFDDKLNSGTVRFKVVETLLCCAACCGASCRDDG